MPAVSRTLLDLGLARGPGDHSSCENPFTPHAPPRESLPACPKSDLMTLTGQSSARPAWASPEQIAGRPTEIDHS